MTTFPALDDFAKDAEVGFATWKVYMYLQNEVLDFGPAGRRVKLAQITVPLGMYKGTVIRALNILVERGYLTEYQRDPDDVRKFSLVRVRPKADAPC